MSHRRSAPAWPLSGQVTENRLFRDNDPQALSGEPPEVFLRHTWSEDPTCTRAYVLLLSKACWVPTTCQALAGGLSACKSMACQVSPQSGHYPTAQQANLRLRKGLSPAPGEAKPVLHLRPSSARAWVAAPPPAPCVEELCTGAMAEKDGPESPGQNHKHSPINEGSSRHGHRLSWESRLVQQASAQGKGTCWRPREAPDRAGVIQAAHPGSQPSGWRT